MRKMKFLSIFSMIVLIAGMIFFTGCDVSQTQKNETSQESTDSLLKSVGAGSQVIQVSAGEGFSMAIVQNSSFQRSLWVIGNNSYGQLGLGDTNNRSTWQNAGITNVMRIACGKEFAMCIDGESNIYVTGNNVYGSLGLGYKGGIVKKWTKTGYTGIDIACGYSQSMFVYYNSITGYSLYVAGINHTGQLGLGDDIDRYSWTRVVTQRTSIGPIACGADFSMYVSGTNDLYVTGNNGHGQLGLGDRNPRYSWTKVNTLDTWQITSIDCGYMHSIIAAHGRLLSNPEYVNTWIWVTGYNGSGQLGLPSSTRYIDTWSQLPLGYINDVACGTHFSLFSSAGNLWVTGANVFGELGLGDCEARYGWVQTGYYNLQYNIDCGLYHSLFISQNNTWGAGRNVYHELGVPGLNNSYWPWFIKN